MATDDLIQSIINDMGMPQGFGAGDVKPLLEREGVNAITNNRLALIKAVVDLPAIKRYAPSLNSLVDDCQTEFMKNDGQARREFIEGTKARWASFSFRDDNTIGQKLGLSK